MGHRVVRLAWTVKLHSVLCLLGAVEGVSLVAVNSAVSQWGGTPAHPVYKPDRWPQGGRSLGRRLAGLGADCGENGQSLLRHLGQGGTILWGVEKSSGHKRFFTSKKLVEAKKEVETQIQELNLTLTV